MEKNNQNEIANNSEEIKNQKKVENQPSLLEAEGDVEKKLLEDELSKIEKMTAKVEADSESEEKESENQKNVVKGPLCREMDKILEKVDSGGGAPAAVSNDLEKVLLGLGKDIYKETPEEFVKMLRIVYPEILEIERKREDKKNRAEEIPEKSEKDSQHDEDVRKMLEAYNSHDPQMIAFFLHKNNRHIFIEHGISDKDIDALNADELAKKLKESSSKKDNKKNPEKEKNTKEKKEEPQESEKMIELREAVERTRLEYARKNNEARNVWLGLKEKLGKNLKTEPEELVSYEQYKKALFDLKNHALEEISSNPNLTPEARRKELGELIKSFNVDEKFDLFSAYTKVKAEKFEKEHGKLRNWFAKNSVDFVNIYRKANWKWKLAGGLALTATGMFGAAGVALVASNIGIVNRVMSGAAAGLGISASLEAKHRKKEGDKAEGKKNALLEGLEHIKNPEDKTAFINNWLDEEIGGLDKDLRTEKREAFVRHAAGLIAGTLIGSGALSHFIQGTLEKTGISGTLAKFFENHSSSATQEVASQSISSSHGIDSSYDNAASHTASSTANHLANSTAIPDVAPEIPHSIELNVPSGSSFEREIIEHLKETGMNNEEAGKMAHRMYLDYVADHPDAATHDYGIIQPGSEIKLAPGGDRIVDFHDAGAKFNHPSAASVPEIPTVQETIKVVDLGDGRMQPMGEYLKNPAVPVVAAVEVPATEGINNKVIETAIDTGVATGGVFGLRRFWDKLTGKKPVTAPFSIPVSVEDKSPEINSGETSESVKVPEIGSESASDIEENEAIESSSAEKLVDKSVDKEEKKEVSKTENAPAEKRPEEKLIAKNRIKKDYIGPAFWEKDNYDILVNVIGIAPKRDGKDYVEVEEIDGEAGNRSEVPIEEIYLKLEAKKTLKEKKEKREHKKEPNNLSFFEKRFGDLSMRNDKIQEIKRKYPELETKLISKEIEKKLRDLYREIRKSENTKLLSKRAKKNIGKGNDQVGKTIAELEAVIEKEEALLKVNQELRDSIQKELGMRGDLFQLKELSKLDLSEMYSRMIKIIGKREKNLDLKGVNLEKVLSKSPSSGIGKIYHHYVAKIGENIAKPRADEDAFSWGHRFLKEVFKSKGIGYNMEKRVEAKSKNKKNDKSK